MSEFLKCGGLNKFVVINRKYLEKLPVKLQMVVETVEDRIAGLRASEFKEHKIAGLKTMKFKEPFPEYLVINTDEIYANEIIDILKKNNAWG